MFLRVFLFTIFLAKVSSAVVAEQDYYKQYHSDDYDDYEYDNDNDDIPDEVTDKPTDGTTKTSETTSEKVESDEVDKLTKVEHSNPLLITKQYYEKTIEPTEITQTSVMNSKKVENEETAYLTKVKHFNPLLVRHLNYGKTEESAGIIQTSEATFKKVEGNEADQLAKVKYINPFLIRNYEDNKEPVGITQMSEPTSIKSETDDIDKLTKVKHFSPLPIIQYENENIIVPTQPEISDTTFKIIDSGTTEKLTKIQLFNPLPVKNILDTIYITGSKPENNISTSNTENNDEITFILKDKPENGNKRPSANYEVTENVDDIPNIVTFRPIVTNFTIKLPLNNATGVFNNINGNSIADNNSGQKNKDSNLRKNTISIFHVNAVFDEDKDKKPVIQNINIHKIPFSIFKITDHVNKFKDDVLNYAHSTEASDEIEEGHGWPNLFSAPRNLVNKFLEKSSALYHKYF